MATILVKGVPDEVLKELKRLKVELGCRTWAELLERLVQSRQPVLLGADELERMRRGVKSFLRLREKVSRRWRGTPAVLEEFRKSRGHGG